MEARGDGVEAHLTPKPMVLRPRWVGKVAVIPVHGDGDIVTAKCSGHAGRDKSSV